MDNQNGGMPLEPTKVDNSQTPTAPMAETNNTPTPVAPITPATETTKPTSLLEKTANEVSEVEKNYWGDDWKQKMSAGDEKILKTIDKFKTPQEAIIAYKELQAQFSRTRPIPELPKDATPEQVKEYREQVGIPESWDKYDTNLENGVVINEFDKPVVEDFLKRAHDKNLKPSEVKNALQAYFEVANEKNAEAIRVAEQKTTETLKELQKEWGDNYKSDLSLMVNHLKKTLGEEEVQKLNSAVLADGTFLIDNPKLLNYFLKDAKANNMNHTVTPNPAQEFTTLIERKAELEKLHATNPKLFYGNPELGKEYNDLLEHERKMSKR